MGGGGGGMGGSACHGCILVLYWADQQVTETRCLCCVLEGAAVTAIWSFRHRSCAD